MKLVLQCGFCRHVLPEEESEKMKEHEGSCEYNPLLKLCDSCAHYDHIYIPDDEACRKGLNHIDTSFDKIPCIQHKAKS